MKSVLEKMTSDGVLSDPAKLLKVLDAATKSLTTDSSLGSLSALTGLADDLKSQLAAVDQRTGLRADIGHTYSVA